MRFVIYFGQVTLARQHYDSMIVRYCQMLSSIIYYRTVVEGRVKLRCYV